MTLKEYQVAVTRTLPDLGSTEMNNLHMILGMVTEVAELADVYKKQLAYGKQVDEVNVKEEIGDQFWYLCNFCTMNNYDIEEILSTNIKKLYTRYPEKFSEDKALIRDLVAEREVLEALPTQVQESHYGC